jgi:hypothetical protein
MEKIILTMVAKDKWFMKMKNRESLMKFGPREFVGNWIVSDRKEAKKIIENCFKELSKKHEKDGKLTKEYIKDKDTYVFYLNEAPSESEWVYEFYIRNEFNRDLGVVEQLQ